MLFGSKDARRFVYVFSLLSPEPNALESGDIETVPFSSRPEASA